MQDVWSFVHRRFCIRPEREAHALVGGSMGGFAAYNLGIKYRASIANVAGILPPLNLRYMDCHGRNFSNFDPDCLGWQEHFRPLKPVARFYHVIPVRERRLTMPLYGRHVDAMDAVSEQNPVEMLFTYDVRPGELEMFVGYAGRDEFNIGAQVESFLYFARLRGLEVTSVYHPNGKHSVASAETFAPDLFCWLKPRLCPYAPCSDCTLNQILDPHVSGSMPSNEAANVGPVPLCHTPATCCPASNPKGLHQWLRHRFNVR